MEKLKLCLVDDDKIFRFTTEKYLEYVSQASQLISFRLVKDAIQYFSDNKDKPGELPDILLLDVNLPGRGGWYFMDEYAKLRGQLTKLPVIFLISSSVDERDQQRAIEHPDVENYITKPLNENRLNEIIKTATKS